MERRNLTLRGITGTLILGLLALIASCTTVTTEVRTGPEENWRYTIKEPRRDTSPNGPVAELRYRGRELLPYFSTVVVGERVFDYQIRIDRGDFRGYRMTDPGEAVQDAGPDSGESSGDGQSGGGSPQGAPAGASDRPPREAIAQDELETNWYFAPLDARKPGTPEAWVWVRRLNVAAFVAPDRISRLADSLDLYPVDGNTEDAPSSGVSLGIRFTTVF